MSSNSDLDQVKIIIRSLLISSPNKLSIYQLSRDYRFSEGEELPFRRFNYRSSYDFLVSIPDTVKILDINDENSLIAPVVSEESAHVYKLVSQQKPSSKKQLPHFRRYPNNYPQRCYQSFNRPTNCQPLKSIQRAFNVQRPELTKDFKEDIYELLQNYPHGMDHDNFDSNVRRILGNHYLGDYSVREVLEGIAEFAFYSNGKVFLNSSDEDCGERSQNNQIIDLTSDGASVIDLISDSSELELSNHDEEISFDDSGGHACISDRLCRDLHSLFDAPENSNGIWLRNLLGAYQQIFSYPLSPEKYGFSDVMDMVVKLPNVFFVKEYPAENDHLLLDTRKYSRSIEYKTERMKAKIPITLIEELKKLLKSEKQIPADDLQSEYKRLYRKELTPQEFGFDNMDSFLHRLEDSCQDIIFARIYNRTVLRLNFERTDKLKLIRKASPNDVTYDPFPPEVCNVDFCLEKDPLMDELKVGDRFEVVLGEIYSPAKFYIVHLTRQELLKEMMTDLNEFYNCHEAKYEVVAPLVSRNLLCACRYSKDPELLWHRVRVVKVVLKTAKIFYVDYGTTEIVDIEQLRYLHKDFAKYPSLCTCARLADIQPRNGENYSKLEITKFYQFYHDVDLEVEIVQVTQKFVEVQMYVLEDNDKILVQERLISLGIANPKRDRFSSPTSDSSETRSVENNGVLLDEARSENSKITQNAVQRGSLAFFNRMVNDDNLKEKLKSTMKKNNFIPERKSPQKVLKSSPPGIFTPPVAETPPIPTQSYQHPRFRAPLPQNIRLPYQPSYELGYPPASYYGGTPLLAPLPRMSYLPYQSSSNTYCLSNLCSNMAAPFYPYQPTPMPLQNPFLLPGGMNVTQMQFAPIIPPTISDGANSYTSMPSQSFKNLTINPEKKVYAWNSSIPVEKRSSIHREVRDDLDLHKMCSTSKLEERKEEVEKDADVSHVPVQTTDSTTELLEKICGDYLKLNDDFGNPVSSEGGENFIPSFSTYTSEFIPKTKPKTRNTSDLGIGCSSISSSDGNTSKSNDNETSSTLASTSPKRTDTRKFDRIRAFVQEQNSTSTNNV